MLRYMQKRRKFRPTLIRQIRKSRRLTLEQLAAKVDATSSHLSMLERGERGYTQEMIEPIADALGTTVDALVKHEADDLSDIEPIIKQATPRQRRQIVEIAKTIVNPEDQ